MSITVLPFPFRRNLGIDLPVELIFLNNLVKRFDLGQKP